MIKLDDQDIYPLQVRAISDGDPANADYTNRGPQDLANRTHNLKKTIDQSGLTREGATRIREVKDEAALRTLTGMADGELASVAKLGGAIFRYDAASLEPQVERWSVMPNSGVGRWLNTARALIGDAFMPWMAGVNPVHDGVKRLREVKDEDELKALTGMQDGDMAYAYGIGLYRYTEPTPAAPPWWDDGVFGPWPPLTTPLIIKPTVGAGVWIIADLARMNMPWGLAWLDPAGRIIAGQPRNGVVQMPQAAKSISATDIADSDFQPIGLDIELQAVFPGDLVDIDVSVHAKIDSGSNLGQLVLARKTGMATYDPIASTEVRVVQTRLATHSIVARVAPSLGGPAAVTYAVLGRREGSMGTLSIEGRAVMRATVYRP